MAAEEYSPGISGKAKLALSWWSRIQWRNMMLQISAKHTCNASAVFLTSPFNRQPFP